MQRKSFRKNAFDLPAEIQYLAKKEGLGKLCKAYPISKRFTRVWVIGQVCLAWGLMGTPIVAVRLFSLKSSSLIFTLAIAALVFLLLIAWCYMSFSRRIYGHWRVSLWQYGFIYEKGQMRQAFQWHQIESIQAGVTNTNNGSAPIIYTYKVRHQGGYEVTLENIFSDSPELIEHVLEEAVRQLAPQEISIVPPRNTRTFTAFKLDRQGIGNEQEALGWQEIQEFMTKNGMVTLRKQEE